jgi:rhodanese-related sulfurtransferase
LEAVPLADLMANWDGLAIAVSRNSIDRSLAWQSRVYVALCAVGIVLPIFVLRKSIEKKNDPACETNTPSSFRLARRCTALVAIATGMALTDHALRDTGFFRNPQAVAEVTRRYFSVDVPERSLSDLKRSIIERNVVLIDARRAPDFRRGALAEAISVPIDSTLVERERALRGIPRSAHIVVYCQSDKCEYSDEIAKFLVFNDFTDVSIFRGGYREWSKEPPTGIRVAK